VSRRNDGASESIAREWLDQLLGEGNHWASVGDRWFLAAVGGVQRGAERTSEGLGAAGEMLVHRAKRRLGLSQTRLDRIRKMLETEIQRSELELSGERTEAFVENMSLLLELVLNGTIPVEDVAIQCDPGTEDDDATSSAPDARPPEASAPPQTAPAANEASEDHSSSSCVPYDSEAQNPLP